MQLSGTTRGVSYDALNVTGAATLGGLLNVSFIDGFGTTIQRADFFTILTAGTISTGTHILTVHDTATWTGGILARNGTLISNGTLTLSGISAKLVGGGGSPTTVVTNGTTVAKCWWTSSLSPSSGANP